MKSHLRSIFYVVLLILLITIYFFFRQIGNEYASILTFKDCENAGFAVSVTTPRECSIPGKVFVEVSSSTVTKEENVTTPETNMNPKNATYQIEGEEISLINGVAVTKDKTVRYFGNEVQADFDANGKEDSAFLLTTSNAGTGTFYYLAVALNTENGYKGINTLFLGDRIAPQTTEFKSEEIVVNYADRNAGEPMTTKPSFGVSRYFKIINGLLTEIKK